MKPIIYVGNALTNVPPEFVAQADEVRRVLKERGYEVKEYLGLKDGTCRDVWVRDMHECVGECHILLAIADYASTGLGIEIGLMIGRHEGPVLIVASEERTNMRNPSVVTRAIQDPAEEHVHFRTYQTHAEIPDFLDEFVTHLERCKGMIFDVLPLDGVRPVNSTPALGMEEIEVVEQPTD